MENQPKYRKTLNSRDAFSEHGKLPPQATDIEEIVLGSMLLERQVIDNVINHLKAEDFYKEAHQSICRAIYEMAVKGQSVDIRTVTNYLKSKGELELCGGAFYVTELTSRIASTANIDTHIGVVKQKAIAREIIRISTEHIQAAYDNLGDELDLLDVVNRDIEGINQMTASGTGAQHVSQAVSKSLTNLDLRCKAAKENKIVGITSGLKKLDTATTGWQGGDLIIIAGRPSMGKTAFALFAALQAAKSNHAVCIYSLEMQEYRLTDRLLLTLSNVSPDKFRSGWVNKTEINELTEAAEKLNRLPIYIDPKPAVKVSYIKSHARIMKRKNQCSMIIVDYLQLVDNQIKGANREQEVSGISRQLKELAKELNVPVILLSQLNRSVETRGGSKRPQLSDLRESGAIEQDADIVIFPHRPEYYEKNNSEISGLVEFIIAKNRNGSTGEITAYCNESVTKFSDEPIIENFTQAENRMPVNQLYNEQDRDFPF